MRCTDGSCPNRRRSATDRSGLTSAAGILLAGGASRRFGRDKLREPIDGEPLFWRPLRALRACDEVVIVVAPDAAEPDLPADMSRARFVRDDAPFGGPLVGCHTGLRSISDAIAVVVAGDMPGLRPEIVALLRRRLQESGASALVLSDGERARPLPLALQVAPALRAAERLLSTAERRLRALVEALDAVVLGAEEWGAADPTGDWRRDVDVPGDV